MRAAWTVFIVGALLTLAVIQALAQAPTDAEKAGAVAAAAQTSAVNWNTIILAVIGMISSAVTTIAGIYLMKMKYATEAALEAARATETSTRKTANSVSEIHTAVNSERTAMLQTVSDLRDEILKMSKVNATLAERLASEKKQDQ